MVRVLPLAAFILQLAGVASQRQISAVASPGNTIHVERDFDLSYDRATIKIKSVVPVTVQRYNDGGTYLEGQQPVLANFGKVLVTSDCETSVTSVVPTVVMSADGSIIVEMDVPKDEADAMPFLDPSSYSAFWTWASNYYSMFPCPTSTPPPISPVPTVVSASSIATSLPTSVTTSSSGSSNVTMIIGACNSDKECTAVVRSRFPEQSSMGVELCQCYAASSIALFDECEGGSDATCLTAKCSNTCEGFAAYCNIASAIGVTGQCTLRLSSPTSITSSSLAPASPAPTVVSAASMATSSSTSVTTSSGSSNVTMIIGTCTSDEECTAVVRSSFPEQSSIGVELCQCYAASSIAPFDECEGESEACLTARCMNTCERFEAYCNIALVDGVTGQCTLLPSSPTSITSSSLAPASQAPTFVSAPSMASSSPTSITTSSGSSNITMIIGMCSSDEECTAVVRSRFPEQSIMGVELCQCYAASSIAPFDECEGERDATCVIAKCSNTCEWFEAYCNIALVDVGTGQCTLVASSTGTTPSGVDFPTPAQNTSSSLVPNPASSPDGASGSSNSAFGMRSFSLRFATTFIAIIAVFVIFQGNGEGCYSLSGFGKVAVVAMAVSSLYSRSSHSSKGSNIQISNQRQRHFPPRTNARNLQTCSFNAEILIDGCTKSVEIDAPSGRVVDAVLTNQTSTLTSDDACSSTTELSANIEFPVTDSTQVLDMAENTTVEAFPEYDYLCMRPVVGRPFVDAKGGSLQATPYVVGDESSWTGESLGKINVPHRSNTTSHWHYLLVEDWTQRALGEHSSVASFSAFSIALMTNQAPSNLVNDALIAGLDEVRHAKTSFEIASVLGGREVRPGPLPPSSHEFRGDLRALALAVAREGCVDETLSAFAAAFEVEHITEVLDKGIKDSLYSNIDHDTLSFIRDELVKIAMDESNHSALAWRTLSWVRTVDPGACDSAYNDVFVESKLEMRFKQRAKGLMGQENSMLHSMRIEWKKIFDAHMLAHSSMDEGLVSEPSCGKKDTDVVNDTAPSLLTSVTDNVLCQL